MGIPTPHPRRLQRAALGPRVVNRPRQPAIILRRRKYVTKKSCRRRDLGRLFIPRGRVIFFPSRRPPHRRWVHETQPHTCGCAERILTAEFQKRCSHRMRASSLWTLYKLIYLLIGERFTQKKQSHCVDRDLSTHVNLRIITIGQGEV